MRVKFTWDFRAYEAIQTAKRHAEHLQEFSEKNNLNIQIIDSTELSEMYAVSYMVLDESQSDKVRKALRPHREEYC